MISLKFASVCLLAVAATSSLAADARERRFIAKFMGEGEVAQRIGKPDHEAFQHVVRGEPEEKTWTYFPHHRYLQTMTILHFHAGRVYRIDRKIAR